MIVYSTEETRKAHKKMFVLFSAHILYLKIIWIYNLVKNMFDLYILYMWCPLILLTSESQRCYSYKGRFT
jgi:hypothetical protein